MVVRLAAAQHPDRLLAAARRPFRRGNDHRRPAVGHQAAVQQMKRPRHPPRIVVIIETHRRVVHLRHRVKVGPLAGSHRDFRHPLPRPLLAIFVHIAGAGHRVVHRGADNPVRRLVLRRRQVAVGRHPHPRRAPRLPVGNQRRLAVPRPDRRHRMGHMNDKGRTADISAVGEHGFDAEILRRRQRGKPGGQDAVHLPHLKPGVLQRVIGRLGMVLQRRLARHIAHNIGFGNPHNGDIPRPRAYSSHCLPPKSRNLWADTTTQRPRRQAGRPIPSECPAGNAGAC